MQIAKKIHGYLLIFMLALLSVTGLQAQVVVTDDITSNTTWTANNEYFLDGLIFVDTLVTLTIEPGTVIKGLEQASITTGDGASALIVRRGARIMAEGTAANPIIFTSELDDVSVPDDVLPSDRGLWGGIILLGRATTNQPTTNNQIEGIPVSENALYGGNDDADNSGVLRYVSIRHGGFSISGVSGDEINGLTMGAVGSGTTIEYIEVYSNFDDGYEWFGGTVNSKYLVSAFCGDDGFDYDQGFRGKGQFWFVLQGSDEAGRGAEQDGGDDAETAEPYAIPTIYNATYIGPGSGSTPDGDADLALIFRDNAGGRYYNSIFTAFVGAGVSVEDLDPSVNAIDSRVRLESGDLVLANNLWWDFSAGSTVEAIVPQDFVRNSPNFTGNQVIDPQLNAISREQNEGLDPRPSASGPAATASELPPNDGFFTQANYIGAFAPNGPVWTEGWTALDHDLITHVSESQDSEAGVPATFALSQNYPNPFNPATTIKYSVPKESKVVLNVYNMLGQKIATLVNGVRPAGEYNVTWEASTLPGGIYLYRLEAGDKVFVSKMTLLK